MITNRARGKYSCVDVGMHIDVDVAVCVVICADLYIDAGSGFVVTSYTVYDTYEGIYMAICG